MYIGILCTRKYYFFPIFFRCKNELFFWIYSKKCRERSVRKRIRNFDELEAKKKIIKMPDWGYVLNLIQLFEFFLSLFIFSLLFFLSNDREFSLKRNVCKISEKWRRLFGFISRKYNAFRSNEFTITIIAYVDIFFSTFFPARCSTGQDICVKEGLEGKWKEIINSNATKGRKPLMQVSFAWKLTFFCGPLHPPSTSRNFSYSSLSGRGRLRL